MFAPLSLMATVAAVVAPAPASPAALCGGDDLSRGNVSMTLRIMDAPADFHSPDVGVRARNEDGSYSFSVGYRPTEHGLGRPHIVHVDILIGLAGNAEARPLRLEWRAPGEAWSTRPNWSTPRRPFPREQPRFGANYRLGQSGPHAHDTEVLDNLAEGMRYEFRNLDQEGRIVSTGAIVYPPQRVIEEMYATARTQALRRLRPCETGRAPATVPPSPW